MAPRPRRRSTEYPTGASVPVLAEIPQTLPVDADGADDDCCPPSAGTVVRTHRRGWRSTGQDLLGTKATRATLGRAMSGTIDADVINEALAIIDRGLGQFLHRELVSTAEATDLLLDVRSLLSGTVDDLDELSPPVPVSNYGRSAAAGGHQLPEALEHAVPQQLRVI